MDTTTSQPSSEAPTSYSAPLPQGNNSGFVPNTSMYMGQMGWFQPSFVPQPSNATVQVNYPVGFPPNMGPAPAPPQNAVANSTVVHVAYNFNPYGFHLTVAFPPHYSSTPPHQYDQSSIKSGPFEGVIPHNYDYGVDHQNTPNSFTPPPPYDQSFVPSGPFAGVTPQHYAHGADYQNTPIPTLQNTHLYQHHGVWPTIASASLLPPATASSVDQKRSAEGPG